jgi:hypothetical protein
VILQACALAAVPGFGSPIDSECPPTKSRSIIGDSLAQPLGPLHVLRIVGTGTIRAQRVEKFRPIRYRDGRDENHREDADEDEPTVAATEALVISAADPARQPAPATHTAPPHGIVPGRRFMTVITP